MCGGRWRSSSLLCDFPHHGTPPPSPALPMSQPAWEPGRPSHSDTKLQLQSGDSLTCSARKTFPLPPGPEKDKPGPPVWSPGPFFEG